MTPPADLKASADQLRRFLSVFHAGVDRHVAEIRALAVPRKYGGPITKAGFFDLPAARTAFWEALKSLLANEPAQPEGVYVTLNPLTIDLLARANNRLADVVGKKEISANLQHVLARHHMLIDVDPTRIAGICATDDEKAAARRVFDGIRDEMRVRLGFGEPVLVIDSGSGYHGWYRIDLPTDDGGRVEKLLKWLARRHDTPAATLDTSTFNPSRISRLPGSWNRKGDHVPDLGRIHRLVTVLETPCEPTSSPPN